ncbi:MAG: EAL domain-containing protein [Actinomycetota bacterium]
MPDEDDEQETAAAVARARGQVWALSGVLSLTVLGALALIPGPTESLAPSSPLVIVLVALGFFVAEPLVFHIEARNESVSFSPTELPLAYGLVFLSPVALVLVRVIVGLAALLTWREQPRFKLVFNVASHAIESVVAMAILRALAPDEITSSPAVWSLLTAGLLVGLLLTGGLIAVAISRFEHDLGDRLGTEIKYGYLFHLPTAILAATAVVPVIEQGWFAAVSVAPVVIIWLLLRSHGSLMHRYSDLSDAHDFSHQVGRSEHLDDIATTAIREVADHLRASRAALIVWDDQPGVVATTAGDSELIAIMPSHATDEDWRTISTPDRVEVILPGATPGAVSHSLGEIGIKEALVAPLADESGPVGLLVLADRHGAVTTFSDEDIGRVRTIARQLTVALRKGRLYVRVQHQATHDRLTGLPNRTLFEAHADAELAQRPDIAVFLLDLDRFKEVNDTMGHHAGDELLVKVSHRLSAVLGGEGLFSRLGGDEFGVVVAGRDRDSATELAHRMSASLEASFPIHGAEVSVGVSIGIALGPDHGGDPTTLLRRADVAMYAAKRNHEAVRVFEDELEDPQDADRLSLLGDLRAAIRLGALDVHFQPKLDVVSGQVVGAEALARWNHPDLGFVGPDQFIPLAERSGLILPLTDRVLSRALRSATRWRDDGHAVGVAVNISAQSLVDDRFPELIEERLAEHGLPGALLTLEITETAMMSDTDRAFLTLARLGDLGVQMSIDDFGTGYSSLVNLRRLPISELKIDRAFVMAMLEDESDEAIVRSTIELGHSLGMSVVAEGVESVEHLGELGMLGCDVAQGYAISRPLPAIDFEKYLGMRTDEGTAVLSG